MKATYRQAAESDIAAPRRNEHVGELRGVRSPLRRPSSRTEADNVDRGPVLEELSREQVLDWRTRIAGLGHLNLGYITS